jgi:hypothetical protein
MTAEDVTVDTGVCMMVIFKEQSLVISKRVQRIWLPIQAPSIIIHTCDNIETDLKELRWETVK